VTVVDSIQTLYLPELASAPGSVSQIRESAARLIYAAKRCVGRPLSSWAT
jgi:DNA repair protein RadA/Sms